MTAEVTAEVTSDMFGSMCCAVCRRPSKHYDVEQSFGYCGYHKNFANVISPAIYSVPRVNRIVLPKCCGLTKLGVACKRNGTVIQGDNIVYCYQHKLTPVSETSVIPGYIRDDCPICFVSLVNGSTLAKTHCGHFFHKECIMTWKNTSPQGNTCPCCRRDTHVSRNASRVTRIYTSVEEF